MYVSDLPRQIRYDLLIALRHNARNLGCFIKTWIWPCQFLLRMLPRNLVFRITKPVLNSFLKENVAICVSRSANTPWCTPLLTSTFAILGTQNRDSFHTSSFRKQQNQEDKSQSQTDEPSNLKRGSYLPY
jgi:hypothetical protein